MLMSDPEECLDDPEAALVPVLVACCVGATGCTGLVTVPVLVGLLPVPMMLIEDEDCERDNWVGLDRVRVSVLIRGWCRTLLEGTSLSLT